MDAIVQTRSGKVRGFERHGVLSFRGIPFAAPPVGARRWLAPEREQPWDDVRDATEFSAECAQGAFRMNVMFGAEPPPRSEDGLYLNVWTPACDDARRPVMVWIHGGAFANGSGSTPWYHGTSFARDGIVCVTVNYRLAAFGFLHLADLFGSEFEGSGNAGILDQVAALEWVRENIDAFGGDPDNVTVFGESAGGGSIGTLLGLPRAKGLFRGAIPQSGAASWFSTRERATEIAGRVIEKLGVKPGDVDALRAKTTGEIVDAIPAATITIDGSSGPGASAGIGLPYQPVVDGSVLPRPPLETIRAGNAEGVRVLTGTNAHEMTLFTLMDPSIAEMDDARFSRRVGNVAGDRAPAIIDTYRAARPGASLAEVWVDVSTDAVFRIPAIRLVEAQQGHAPAWMYVFTWASPAFGGALRSTHALEIPFVFQSLDSAEMFTGNGPEREGIARRMHDAWVAFAKLGDPSTAELPDWPQYDLNRRATMRFDVETELLDDPDGAERELWSA